MNATPCLCQLRTPGLRAAALHANVPAGEALSAGCSSPADLRIQAGSVCPAGPAAINAAPQTHTHMHNEKRPRTEPACAHAAAATGENSVNRSRFSVELVVFSVTPTPLLSLRTHAAADGINWLLFQRMLINGSALRYSQHKGPMSGFLASASFITDIKKRKEKNSSERKRKRGECGGIEMRLGEGESGYLPCGSREISWRKKPQPAAGRQRRGVRRGAPRCDGQGFVGISAGLFPVFTDSAFPDIPDFPDFPCCHTESQHTDVKLEAGKVEDFRARLSQ